MRKNCAALVAGIETGVTLVTLVQLAGSSAGVACSPVTGNDGVMEVVAGAASPGHGTTP